MTLPQEMQQAIANRAAEYANQQCAHDGDDIHIGYLDGAYEWAGKAQGLVDVIFLIYKDGAGTQTTIDKVNKALIDFFGNQTAIDNALAKYKEATNG